MDALIDGFQNTVEESRKGRNNFRENAFDGSNATSTSGKPNTEGVKAGENSEGTLTKQIERVTTKWPSSAFLTLAMASVALSATLRIFGNRKDAQFVGQWVPTILTLGLYNKLVKLEGSE